MATIKNNEEAFDKVCLDVKNCNLCSRMCKSQRILSRASGAITSKIMFIAEAPGRLGADQYSIPLHGDKTGHNFEELLEFVNLDRSELFITNAVLCNPKDQDGNNSTPNKQEISNCASFLKKQIEIVNPDLIVTLGATALYALSLIEPHSLSLKKDVRTVFDWFGRKLIPLYHPGQRAMLHRSMANQRSDYKFVIDIFKNLRKTKSLKTGGHVKADILAIITYMLNKQSISYFALHKLFYLVEYQAFLNFGHRLTNAYIIRQKDGPYCTDLHINKLKNSISGLHTKFTSRSNFLLFKQQNSLFEITNDLSNSLSNDVMDIIDSVMDKYACKNNTSLKRSVYFTRPMRNILFYESNYKINLYNAPIQFVDEYTLAK